MNICTFGSSDKKAAAAATSRTRRSLLRVGFLLLFVLVFRFPTVQVYLMKIIDLGSEF